MGRNLNKALRIMNFAKNTASSKPIYHKFDILNLNDSYTLQCAKFMYDVNTGTQLDFLCQLFQKTTSRHSYDTRQAAKQKFAIPQARTNLNKRFITFNGVKIWNEIPLNIRSKPIKRLPKTSPKLASAKILIKPKCTYFKPTRISHSSISKLKTYRTLVSPPPFVYILVLSSCPFVFCSFFLNICIVILICFYSSSVIC